MLIFIQILDKRICILVHNRVQKLGGLNNRNLFSHNSGGWKSKIMILSGLDFSDAFLLDLWMAVFYLCLHRVFPLCMSVCTFLLFIKTPVMLD